jgi:hypothetical protein
MPVSTASVATDRPGRYAKQLVSHLSRRLSTEWDEASGTGWIQLDTGRAELSARTDALDIRIDADDLDRFEDVIGRHLVRFAKKDVLVVQWARGDGTPGTSYRNETDETIGNS